MASIVWKGTVVSFGSGTSDLSITSGIFTATVNTDYNNGTIASGAIFVIPSTVRVRFKGTLTNNGTITGGSAQTAGTTTRFIPNTIDELIPSSGNGATGTAVNLTEYNYETGSAPLPVAAGSVKIMAKNFVNNGLISTSGNASTATTLENSSLTAGVNGSGAGVVLIISEQISGTGSITAAGGAGVAGHVAYTFAHTCWYNANAQQTQASNTYYTNCWGSSGGCSREGGDGPHNNTSYGATGWDGGQNYSYSCPTYYTALGSGVTGTSGNITIITSSVPSGGTTTSETKYTTISTIGGSIIWFQGKWANGTQLGSSSVLFDDKFLQKPYDNEFDKEIIQ